LHRRVDRARHGKDCADGADFYSELVEQHGRQRPRQCERRRHRNSSCAPTRQSAARAHAPPMRIAHAMRAAAGRRLGAKRSSKARANKTTLGDGRPPVCKMAARANHTAAAQRSGHLPLRHRAAQCCVPVGRSARGGRKQPRRTAARPQGTESTAAIRRVHSDRWAGATAAQCIGADCRWVSF
jgi:hypothetical protein